MPFTAHLARKKRPSQENVAGILNEPQRGRCQKAPPKLHPAPSLCLFTDRPRERGTVMGRHNFLSIKDFSPKEIHYLLDLAREMKAHPSAHSGVLKGKTLAMIFEKPSLRTRVSFDVGIQQLGGFSLYLSNAEINLGKRESVYDVAKNLERMVQGIKIRTFAHEIVEKLAEYASIPVINGLSDFSHPCQAMADFLTIFEIKGKVKGKKVAY